MRSGRRPGRRKLVPVDELPLVGGLPCLDLVNTTGARATPSPRERLHSYRDLLVWTRRAGILGAADADRLRSSAARRPVDAAAALERVRALREEIYVLFRAVAEAVPPTTQALAKLSAWWRDERKRRELVAVDGGFVLELRVGREELDAMLWPVVASAMDLLTSERRHRVKRCGECDWLFVDESKNGSRTWCKKQCGDRIRARRHYERTRRPRIAARKK